MENIYADIAARTGGNIYIGVSGPVRTGKSTLIKRIMEELVIPNIDDPFRKERARDELPQSGSGRTITTSEPKFVPEDAVEISPDGTVQLGIRMIDSVGYMVDGAVGAEEDGVPRMVTTPWYDHEIPMTEAAELGTKKVMQEHCSVGLVVTTDGSVTDIPREDYIQAEQRAIRDMQNTGKPFLVVVNSREPGSSHAQKTAGQIASQFGIQPVVVDAQAMDTEDIAKLLGQLLYAFPMQELHIHLPRWIHSLAPDHPVRLSVYEALLQQASSIRTLSQAAEALAPLGELEPVADFSIRRIDPGTGTVSCAIRFPDSLFYEILSTTAGVPVRDDSELVQLLTELSQAKQEYDKFSDAIASVNATGYGIVMPGGEQFSLDPPELLRKNGAFGVKLRAGAPSIHMIRVDIDTQLSPIVGDEKQSQELISYLSGESPEALWQSNIFGKSVYEMVQDGIRTKLMGMSPEVREKFRGTLTKIVNDGANGLFCLIV